VLQQRLNKRLFAAESSEQFTIDIDRLARFSPTLQSQPARETETPLLRLAKRLQFGGSADDLIHDRRLS
jgi:hypothetical protein